MMLIKLWMLNKQMLVALCWHFIYVHKEQSSMIPYILRDEPRAQSLRVVVRTINIKSFQFLQEINA